MFGTLCIAIANLLYAAPIPTNTSYWAYGFPAMCLCVMGADTLFPSLMLFNAHSLPKADQALGGAMINAVGQVGRAIGLAIGTAIQIAVQESKAVAGSTGAVVTGSEDLDNPAYLAGIRAADWFSVGLALSGFCVAAVAFRGTGIIGGSHK